MVVRGVIEIGGYDTRLFRTASVRDARAILYYSFKEKRTVS